MRLYWGGIQFYARQITDLISTGGCLQLNNNKKFWNENLRLSLLCCLQYGTIDEKYVKFYTQLDWSSISQNWKASLLDIENFSRYKIEEEKRKSKKMFPFTFWLDWLSLKVYSASAVDLLF